MIGCTLLLAWMLTDAAATLGVIHYRRNLIPLAAAQESPPAVIVIAIKGVSESTPGFLKALCDQDYSNYRLLFAVESESDPSFALIERLRDELGTRISLQIVVAGMAAQRAQKVHNLLAALSTLGKEDRIVVLADADILPDRCWLSQLVRPIARREAAASTGYRWLLPIDRRLPSLIVAAVDLSIATAPRSWRWNVCWGGSMAVDRAALDQIDLQALWDRAASDDLTLASALRSRGLRINAPVHVLVPSPIAHTWASLFSFSHRQYLLLRTYAPWHWLLVGWTLFVPALAALTALSETVEGHWWTLGVLAASVALLELRLSIRRQIADLLLPSAAKSTAKTTIAFARWAWPLIHLVNCAAFVASGMGRSFTWAGIRYRVLGKQVSVRR